MTNEEIRENNVQNYEKDYHDPNNYRIRCGYIYPVYRKEYGGNIFYKIPAGKLKVNGELTPVYKGVSFYNLETKKYDTSIQDGTLIKIKSMYESGYYGKNDKYNVVWTLIITDWEVHTTEEQQKKEAIEEYKKTVSMSDFDFNDDLPF